MDGERSTDDGPQPAIDADTDAAIEDFWKVARVRANVNPTGIYTGTTGLESVRPPAWAFGANPEQADRLLELILNGAKTATASALWDYQAVEEAPPKAGDLNIILDGSGAPRALIMVTDVRVAPFEEVDAEHAEAEGEGDRTIESWRADHERFFTEFADHNLGFSPDMPVVLERFKVLYSD